MRYEDWDVLLFPRDCRVPLKEFKVACHVVQDLEASHTHGSSGIPTVCCFVPSLLPGSPFQVSLHSWTGFPDRHGSGAVADTIRFEARLYIDGRLVSSNVIDRNETWPHVFTHTFGSWKAHDVDVLAERVLIPLQDIDRNGEPRGLVFPKFREELLKQSFWSPADDLGRIKLVISEGFPRNSVTNPIDRIRNIVAFSFQHAPSDVLEGAGIAWPNQSMWCRAPFAAFASSASTGTHIAAALAKSPALRRPGNTSRLSGMTEASTSGISQPPMDAYLSAAMEDDKVETLGDHVEQGTVTNADEYFEWLNGLAATDERTQLVDFQSGHNRVSCSSNVTDPNLGDPNTAEQGLWETTQGSQLSSAVFKPDDEMGESTSRVPSNTPTASGHPTYASRAVPQSLLPRSSALPAALAQSITKSILGHIPPPQVSNEAQGGLGPAVRSRKENKLQSLGVDALPSAIPSAAQMAAESREARGIRKISQAFTDSEVSIESGGSIGGASLDDGIALSRGNSPLGGQDENSRQYDTSIQGPEAPIARPRSKVAQDTALTATSGNSLSKGTKRNRNFTPASAKELLEQREQRRVSPRTCGSRSSPFRNELHQDYGADE